jgi:pyruvate formate lyase activating enzyme
LLSHAYGNPCIVSKDPIEKTPLCHFLPGQQTLTLATGGCNLRCLYCQNYRFSQAKPEKVQKLELFPSKAAHAAEKQKLDIITFTYTEPVAYMEYMLDICQFVRKKNVRTVAATAAYATVEAIKEMAKHLDAFCIALKGFTEKFYEKVCGIELKPVLEAIVAAKETNRWLELVTLIVPTYNDDPEEIKQMCKWIVKNLGSDTPLHFSRFVPEYKLRHLPRTPIRTLEIARETALECGIKFVYINNVSPHPANHTYCPRCRKELIRRLGFRILCNNIKAGKCKFCGEKISGLWQ